MSVSLDLVLYAGGVATLLAAVLRGSRWVRRSPRLGIAAWMALLVSTLLSLVAAGIAPLVPDLPAGWGVADLLDACMLTLRSRYAAPGDALAHVAVGSAGLTILVVSTAVVCHELARSARWQAAHRAAVDLAGRRDERLEVHVVDHAVAVAYCLPGRNGRVVVSTAVVRALNEEQLAALLAHERAHLSGRHYLVSAATAALARTFGWIPTLRWARVEVAGLLEMLADDRAAAMLSPQAVASALASLANMPGTNETEAPRGGRGNITERVARLRDGSVPVGPLARAGVAIGVGLLTVLPVLVLTAPAALSLNADRCPTDIDAASGPSSGLSSAGHMPE